MKPLQVIILAGGKGTRMNSFRPKVLIELGTIPMVHRVLAAVLPVDRSPILSVGFGGDKVIEATGGEYRYVFQDQQLGTGYAVLCAKQEAQQQPARSTIVIPGDHPMITAETLRRLFEVHTGESNTMTISTVRVPNFEGEYEPFATSGRVIRNEASSIEAIVELAEATPDQKAIKEVNVSYYCFDSEWLWENVGTLKNNNASGEYYLTDMVGLAIGQGKKVGSYLVENPVEGLGVNTPRQLEIVQEHAP